ncbi:MAG: hypothetical protein HKN80_13625 [Acidimicrobiia bacterium]|nr:hypothetical protein [Acidimicrobiia bacterium]
MSTDPHILHPGHAPTPFTAAEIRAGCPVGRTIRLAIQAGGASHTRVIRFVACSEDGASQESQAFTEWGETLGEPTMNWTSWAQFQEHASFPQAATSIEVEALNTPLGRLECRAYTVVDGDEVTRFWFAVPRPGMPVRVEQTVAGEVVQTTIMVDDRIS